MRLPIFDEVESPLAPRASDYPVSEEVSDRQRTNLQAELIERGFAVCPVHTFRALAKTIAPEDWARFAQSWDDMPLDDFMGDGGRYRRRRFSTFSICDGVIRPKPAQPHFQSRAYNPLNGDLHRIFAPFAHESLTNPAFLAILRLCDRVFSALSPECGEWHAEAHQFRIEATGSLSGKPTPEGMHRDGVDWVLTMLVGRRNVVGGTTRITAQDGSGDHRVQLSEPLDSCLLDDQRLWHGVTPIRAIDPEKPASRDALVITFTRSTAGDGSAGS